MKHFKRLFSYLVALTMVLSLAAFAGVNVHAEEVTYKITLNNAEKTTTKDHTYHAYQIFSGDLKVNKDDSGKVTSKVLSNIKWGTGIDSSKTSELITALKNDNKIGSKFNDANDAASVAKALEGVTSDSKEMDEFAQVVGQYLSNTSKSSSVNSESKKTEINGLAAGYYLVKDTLDTDKDNKVLNENDAYTKFIVDVVGDTEATIKSDVPTVVKKVKDTNDSNGETSGWQDSADADFNDNVEYQITGTMPDNIADYTSYKYVFTDTMSKGLTYTAGNAKITIGGKDVTSSFEETRTANDGTTTVTWACDNLKGIGVTLDKDTKVVVTYSCKLNENAVIGSKGNPNEVYLTYSNNPNNGGEGETGKTPKDKVIVFTYKTVVNKVDQEGNKLAGAGFTLQKKIKKTNGTEYQDVKTIEAGNTTTFSFEGLDDGDYKLIESTTPAGYNTIAPIEFTISATHSETADEPKLLTLTGDKADGTAFLTTSTEKKDDKDIPTGELTASVKNQKGSILPSTGGMGTTLLYAAGGILVACAAAYVIINRKKSAKK